MGVYDKMRYNASLVQGVILQQGCLQMSVIGSAIDWIQSLKIAK